MFETAVTIPFSELEPNTSLILRTQTDEPEQENVNPDQTDATERDV